MRFHREASKDRYDTVVVGSGLGGLTAASLLARAGQQVLVVERHDRVGGYAHSFRRGRYLFDAGVHMVGGCGPSALPGGGAIHQLLSALGIRDRLDFRRVDPCYAARYPDGGVRAPCDLEEFIHAHAASFPAEEKGLRQIVQECLNLFHETNRVAELTSPFEVMKAPDRFPTLLRYRRATLAQVLDEHLESPRLKALLGTLWPYLGLPPSQLSFLYFSAMLMSYVADGAYYCTGSFQRLADALADVVCEAGGEVLLRSPVRRIPVEAGRAAGVVLENGQRIAADRVLSNADALQTIDELVGSEHLPRRYLKTLHRMKPSLSAFVAYIATDLPIDAATTAHETFHYPSWNHDTAWASSDAGRPSWLSVTVPTLADPSLAPDGEHLVVLTTLVRHDAADWRREKQRVTDHVVGLAGQQLPGLSEHLRFCEAGTPRTMERYTRNTAGAIYGWELSPAQVGLGRPGIRTPVRDLYFVGHWSQPGGGVTGVVSSGVQAARGILERRGDAQLWHAIRAAPR